jgi:hypothetical protein
LGISVCFSWTQKLKSKVTASPNIDGILHRRWTFLLSKQFKLIWWPYLKRLSIRKKEQWNPVMWVRYTGMIWSESGIGLTAICTILIWILWKGNAIFVESWFRSEVIVWVTFYAVYPYI